MATGKPKNSPATDVAKGEKSPPKTLSARLDEIFASANRSDAPGLVVGVAHHGKTIYRRAFGLASVEHAVANTPETRMRIGSTSKHFTCLAALLLAEEGKLDLDAPANQYLPKLPQLQGMPTLRNFMTHTSGYRCSLDVSVLANDMATQPPGFTEAVMTRQTEVNFAPNHGQMYCNGGYHLLSLVIERVAKMPFEEFIKTRIFEPLGMAHTASVPSDMQMIPGTASLHIPLPGGAWRRGLFMTEEIKGEGAMISTIDDMLRWLAHLNGPKSVGTAETWRQMFEPARLENGLVSVYSCGLNRNLYRGVEVVHHGGSVIGGNSQMLTVPAEELDIALMCNTVGLSAQLLTRQVIDLVLGDEVLGKPAKMAKAKDYKHLFGARYHGKSGVMVAFGAVGEQLGLSLLGSGFLPVLRDETGVLRAGFEDIALGPIVFKKSDLAPNSKGKAPATIDYSESGYIERLAQISGPPSAKAWRGLVGRFRSHDVDADAEVRHDKGELTLHIKGEFGHRDCKLEMLCDDVASASAIGSPGVAYTINLERKGRKIQAFRVESVRARHLKFERIAEA